jgi:antibiotic biosynthesis monooxygenase (ABM) superfamily enzyme
MDAMSRKETLLQLFLVWLGVYPSVLVFTYGMRWLGITVPLPVEILISTALTVPLITFVVQPIIFRRIARMRGESPAELMRREAEDKAREGA